MDNAEAASLHACIKRAVRAVCPGWLGSEVEDLAQAATVRVLQRFGSGSPTGAAPAARYLWRTAHSVVVDEIRRRSRRPTVPLAERPDAAELPAADGDAESALAVRRLGTAIRDCLRRLAPSRRQAVSLHLVGHTLREISELLALGEKRVQNLVYRGLADLRSCLRSKGAHP
jgi:RNA polymerase sigma-70 factor (ECF subfamily)